MTSDIQEMNVFCVYERLFISKLRLKRCASLREDAHRKPSQLTKETEMLTGWRDKIIFHNLMSGSKEGILQYSCCAYSLDEGQITFVRSVNNALVTSSRFNSFFPSHPERPPVCSCETLWTTRIISSPAWPGLKYIQPVGTRETQHLLQIKTAEPQKVEERSRTCTEKSFLHNKSPF